MILWHEEKIHELALAAQAALERMQNRLDEATIRPVVTRYNERHNIFGRRYAKVHTMEYAVWPVDGLLFLCSDGKVYIEHPDRDFWNRKVTNLMPIEDLEIGSYDLFTPYLENMGKKKPGSITGWG